MAVDSFIQFSDDYRQAVKERGPFHAINPLKAESKQIGIFLDSYNLTSFKIV